MTTRGILMITTEIMIARMMMIVKLLERDNYNESCSQGMIQSSSRADARFPWAPSQCETAGKGCGTGQAAE